MKMNRQLWTFLLLAVAIFTVSACSRETGVEAAREDDQPALTTDQLGLTPAEQDFLFKVTQSNTAEIMFARQAMQKSKNRDVKDFAHMLESDHTNALEQLADVMKDKNIVHSRIPTTEAAQQMDMMSDLSGADFDREYVNMMVEKHQKSIELFRDLAGIARDPDIKEFATDTLPTLEMHLEKAQALQSKLFSGTAR